MSRPQHKSGRSQDVAARGSRGIGIMATKRKTGGSKLPAAFAMLAKDHKAVNSLFKQYEKGEDTEKRTILQSICAALTAHAKLEEEIFYPALRAAFGDEGVDLLDEATVEHATLKALIAELEDAEPGDALVDAKVTVLSEYVKHHVQEEEDEIFPKAKKTKALDLDALGEEMAARKEELATEVGAPPARGGRGASRGEGARAAAAAAAGRH